MVRADGKHIPVKINLEFAFIGYKPGRSGEERPDAQARNTHTYTHSHKYTILVPIVSALKGIVIYLALRCMGPSTDR